MPRPRRTKVASQGPRVATSSEDMPTSKPSKADSMAPLKKPRGGTARFKPTNEVDEIESSGQRPQKKAATKKKKAKARPAKKKVTSVNDYNDNSDEVEEVQTSALNALRARMSDRQVDDKSSSGAAKASQTSLESDTSQRRRSSLKLNARVRQRVSSTSRARQPSFARSRTPSVQLNTDDDLYGLTPPGKGSQARLGPRRSSVSRAPLSALKVHGTPGMETSILALQNFKRRPRQPSMIRMVQQSSELGKEDEEAYLGIDVELDDTLRDFDNFVPEDESTPLNFGRMKQVTGATGTQQFAQAVEPRTSSSRKRKRTETEEDVQIPRSVSPYGSSPPHIEGTTWARSARSSSLPDDGIVASTEEQDPIYAEPVSQSDTVAPPRSSSELATPKRRKTRGQAPKEKPVKATAKQAKKPPKISTAHLQSLLPKARIKPSARSRQPPSTYDIPSDAELDTTFDLPDEDELSRPVRRGTSVRPTKTPLAKKDTNKRLSKKPKSPATMTNGKRKRTYSRQKSVEQENDDNVTVHSDDEDEDTIEISGGGEKTTRVNAGKSKELENARKMFAAIDEWEMEFESVDISGGESSPWR